MILPPALTLEVLRRLLVCRLDSGERQLSGADNRIRRQANSLETCGMCSSRKLILGTVQSHEADVFEDYSLEDEGKLKPEEWYKTFPCGGLYSCEFKGDVPWQAWIPA
jgi:hypothetical protein